MLPFGLPLRCVAAWTDIPLPFGLPIRCVAAMPAAPLACRVAHHHACYVAGFRRGRGVLGTEVAGRCARVGGSARGVRDRLPAGMGS